MTVATAGSFWLRVASRDGVVAVADDGTLPVKKIKKTSNNHCSVRVNENVTFLCQKEGKSNKSMEYLSSMATKWCWFLRLQTKNKERSLTSA